MVLEKRLQTSSGGSVDDLLPQDDAMLQQDTANSIKSRQRCLGLLKAPVSIIVCNISGLHRVVCGDKVVEIDILPPLTVNIHSSTGMAARHSRSNSRRK